MARRRRAASTVAPGHAPGRGLGRRGASPYSRPMSDVAGPPARATRPGRPRLFEPDVERQRLMDAAVEVLRRNGGNEATVADILAEAGLSTRAFYRHFHSKEDVVRALYRRDAESFGRHLRRAMAQ